jgi:Zn finger protein HypA/HybF involved in hydrogenase expression
MSNNEEFSIIKCKGCGQTKKRVMDGRYANTKDIRWIDPETKKQFSGHKCPTCHADDVAKRKRNRTRSNNVII